MIYRFWGEDDRRWMNGLKSFKVILPQIKEMRLVCFSEDSFYTHIKNVEYHQ